MAKNLTVNVQGGAMLSQSHTRELKEGKNTIKLKNVDPSADPASIDLIESGSTPFGSLDLTRAVVHPVPEKAGDALFTSLKGARLTVNAKEAGPAEFTTQSAFPASVGIQHRVAIGSDGKSGEFTTKAKVTNAGTAPLNNVPVTITAGDTSNAEYLPRSFGLADRASTSVSAVDSTVYRFDLPGRLTLKPGESQAVSLFGKDSAVGDVGKELELRSRGNYRFESSRSSSAGPIQTFYNIENTEANGMGLVLPAGGVTVKVDGVTVSNTNIPNISQGEAIRLNGGQAFDLSTTRKQTSFASSPVAGAGGPGLPVGTGRGVLTQFDVGQEITLCSNGPKDEMVNVHESIPGSEGGEAPVISNVKVDGRPAPMEYSADNGTMFLSNIHVPAGGEAKLTFDVSYKNTVFS